jgi:hypothetical protein
LTSGGDIKEDVNENIVQLAGKGSPCHARKRWHRQGDRDLAAASSNMVIAGRNEAKTDGGYPAML